MKVCVFGQIGNGKTTFAKMVMHRLNDSIRMRMAELQITHVFELGAFAKAVKESVAFKFGIPLADVDAWKNRIENYPGWSCTMRQALQREGEAARQIDPNVWIRKVMKHPYPQVIHDGRYENEAEAIHTSGGYNILIFRPDYINDSDHPSEAFVGNLIKSIVGKLGSDKIPNVSNAFKYFRHIVGNEGDLDTLDLAAQKVSEEILNHYKRLR